MVIEITVALIVAVGLTALLVYAVRRKGPWGSVWSLFAALILVAWAFGIWLVPFNPPVFGITWLPFLLVGVIAALLVAAFPNFKIAITRRGAESENPAASGLSAVLWLLLATMAVGILIYWIANAGRFVT